MGQNQNKHRDLTINDSVVGPVTVQDRHFGRSSSSHVNVFENTEGI